ncbi:MAG: alpha/beta hydrolase [Planctomycetes bacterium]|nr:alpha/beta hydrolase [Planctomycetota bacterium]
MKTTFRIALIPAVYVLLLCAGLAGGVHAELTRYEYEQNITYAEYDDGAKLQLDLYRPENREHDPLPAIVFIHGGGWRRGSRDGYRDDCREFARRGYVAVTISYRLVPETFPKAIYDCKAAVRWLRANSEKWGIDPDRIGATGSSAGGHLSALLATSGGCEEIEGSANPDFDSSIQCAAPYCPVMDMRPASFAPLVTNFMGGGLTDALKENYELASPVFHLDKDDPPMLVIHGTVDMTVPVALTRSFVSRAEEIGANVRYIEAVGGEHSLNQANMSPSRAFIDEEVVKFFQEHLNPPEFFSPRPVEEAGSGNEPGAESDF